MDGNEVYKDATDMRIRSLVRSILSEKYPNVIVTNRICSRITDLVRNNIEKGNMRDDRVTISNYLQDDRLQQYVKRNTPNVSKVPDEVVSHINRYFSENNISAVPVVVLRGSNHPDDSHLYQVVANDRNRDTCSVWTCWNEDKQSLDHGHYGISSPDDALDIVYEYFNDITDEVDKYGPTVSAVNVKHDRMADIKADIEALHNELVNSPVNRKVVRA